MSIEVGQRQAAEEQIKALEVNLTIMDSLVAVRKDIFCYEQIF